MLGYNQEIIERPLYPFTAVVGQTNFKLALILNAIDPTIGGVLLTGPKGTGKSTLVKSFVEVLPSVEVAEDCVFSCNPKDPSNMCDKCRSKFQEEKSLRGHIRKMRIVQIPIGATEDRVIGTMDVEEVIQKGVKTLQPGLLAEANQNILYIDEVNLLPDHLVDAILDSAASGWNFVEREGISIGHPSRFVLVGTMNPEEGSLRPQIADRFGIHAQSEYLNSFKDRIELIHRNEVFTKEPLAFREKYFAKQEALSKKIEDAKTRLGQVKASDEVLESIAKICSSLEVDGYRPDIVTLKAARALAAFEGRASVESKDLFKAAELAFSHRTRISGSLQPPSSEEIQEALVNTPFKKEILTSRMGRWWRFYSLKDLKKLGINFLLTSFIIALIMVFTIYFSINMVFSLFQLSESTFTPIIEVVLAFLGTLIVLSSSLRNRSKKNPIRVLDLSKITLDGGLDSQKVVAPSSREGTSPVTIEYGSKEEVHLNRGQNIFEQEPLVPEDTVGNTQKHKGQRPRRGTQYLVGKRAKIVTSSSRGRWMWHQIPKSPPFDIALGPTIRAAAPYQSIRSQNGLAVSVESQDIRVKKREYRAPFSIMLLVDLSWSMTSSVSNIIRAIRTLHKSVYRRRDRVGLIVFKGREAFTVQEPTTNLELIIRKLMKNKASDFTPMAAGMLRAWRTLKLEVQRNKDVIPIIIMISDGITNIPLKQPLTARRRGFLSEPQYDSFDVARLIRRDKIHTIIINTFHNKEPIQDGVYDSSGKRVKPYTPTEFLMELSKQTGGSYYGLSLEKETGGKETVVERPEDWFYFESK